MPPAPLKERSFRTLTFACCAALYMCPTCARATILFWLHHWYGMSESEGGVMVKMDKGEDELVGSIMVGYSKQTMGEVA